MSLDPGNIKMKSPQIALDGTKINVAANATVSVEGNATAELSASGQTTIKGALVKIN